MKKLTNILTAGLLLTILLTTGCKKDDDGGPTLEEEQLAALDGTWTATSVTDDAGARADYFDPAAFQLIIDSDNKLYATENGPDKLPFPPEGSFALGSDNAVTSLMILRNEYEINYAISTNGQLTLTISGYQGEGYDNLRTESVVGNWTFVFEK